MNGLPVGGSVSHDCGLGGKEPCIYMGCPDPHANGQFAFF